MQRTDCREGINPPGLLLSDHNLKAALENLMRLASVDYKLPPLVVACRPSHWIKNGLVVVPLLTAHTDRVESYIVAAVAVGCYCLLSSSAYLINDLVDRDHDRQHPWKKNRPIATGEVSPQAGLLTAIGLLATGLLLGLYQVSFHFLLILGCYYALTLLYSFYLKRQLIVDITALSSLFTLRIAGGAVAVSLELSIWFITFSLFIFFSLATVKRLAELTANRQSGLDQVSGRAYQAEDIPLLGSLSLASGYVAVLTFALYVNSANAQLRYAWPEILWLTCIVLLYWIGRLVLIANRGDIRGDPINFSIRDRCTLGCAIIVLGLFITAKFTQGF